MPNVSIAIQPDILERFSDLNFKPSQAIAEFIDNAIQSYLDFKNNGMFYHTGYKLTVDINIDWAEYTTNHKIYAKTITITDNAAGIAIDRFKWAFETGHKPTFNEGLNEYGMGMKTAAFWLSRRWKITSKSFSETKERTLSFDLNDIVEHKRSTLDFQENDVAGNSSYTKVQLEELHQKNNFTKRMLPYIKAELSSIYRAFLRRGEIQINVNDEALIFIDPKILHAPYYSDPNSENIEWKVQFSKNMFGKEISGYIGILNEMSEKQSGLVVIRRGRVIVGESSDHLYHPQVIFGTYKNGFVYKRLYGEIEIKGFSASFNKNGFSNVEELETMLGLIKPHLNIGQYNIINQANKLRVNIKKPQLVTIIWKFANGMADKVEEKELNSNLSVPATPTRIGYTFNGWFPIPQTTVTENSQYTAQWKPIQNSNSATEKVYEVLWVFDNGQDDKIAYYHSGEGLIQPNIPYKEGFTFAKWDPTPTDIVSEDAIYTAKWNAVESTPQPNVIAYRVFDHDGTNVRIELIESEKSAPLLTLILEKFYEERIVMGMLNVARLPIADKTAISDDVKNLLLSIAIGMFETQMSGDDTCDGLMKNVR